MAQTAGNRRRRPFVALCAATSISLVGNELTAIALPWLVLTSLGSAFDTGIVGAGVVLPAVIGAVAGGVIVDRLGSRRTSVLGDLTSAVAVAAIPIAGLTVGLSVPLVLAFAFLGALLDAPGATARQVLVPDVARQAGIGLERANSIFQTVQNVSLTLGPIGAGLVIAFIGPVNALWFDAASFVVSAAIILLGVPKPSSAAPAEEVADVLAGIRLVTRDRLLGALTLVAVVANLVGTPLFAVLLPAFAIRSGVDAGVLGLLVGAFAAGMVVGSLGYGVVGVRLRRRLVLVVGFAATGLGIGIVALAPPLPVAIAALVLAGVMTGPINPIVFTVMQERIPEPMRGRAFGAILGGVLVGAPVGMLALGGLTELQGPAVGLAAASAAFLAVALVVAALPTFRGLDDEGAGVGALEAAET